MCDAIELDWIACVFTQERLLICFFFMIYLLIQPNLESSHFWFMISSQWGIFLQLYGVYLIVENSFEAEGEMIGRLIVGVGLVLACFGLVEIGKRAIEGNGTKRQGVDLGRK